MDKDYSITDFAKLAGVTEALKKLVLKDNLRQKMSYKIQHLEATSPYLQEINL